MGALFKSSIFLALAIAIGVYLYLSLSDEDVTSVLPEAPVASVAAVPVAPVAEAAQADIDDDLVDYLVAQRIGSLEGWRAFLTAHASGLHAQLATAEVEKLLHAEKTPAPAIAEVSHGASPDGQAGSEAAPPAAPPAGTEVAALMLDEICKRDEERLERLRSNPSSEEAARFADELGCEKLRPQLLALSEGLGRSAPSAAAIGVAKSEASDIRATNDGPALQPPLLPNTQVAAATPDDVCKRDEERLERLRSNPSSEEAARFADELGCEKLRPQIARLAKSLGHVASTPISAAEGPSAKGSLAQGQKAEGDCASERDRLDRLRAQPSVNTAQQLWRDLRCERLRPQVRLLLESLNVAADPSGACRREAEELSRIRTNPNRREAEGFARDMTCETLRPQAARLLESLTE
jgi:hypothetical protein